MAKQVALVAQRCEEAKENGRLDMTECDLTKVPDGIFMLTRSVTITTVDFSRNKLRRLSPQVAVKYPQLTELRMCQNFLQDLPQAIEGLESLRILDVSWNSLHFIPAVVFRLPALERLMLQQNQITKVPMKELREMKSLHSIHLEKNPLEEDAAEKLKELAGENSLKIYL